MRRSVNGLGAQGEHVVVLGDLNEVPSGAGSQTANLSRLFDNHSPLVDCYSLANFQFGSRRGTFDPCGWTDRLDYIVIFQNLTPHFNKRAVFREGLWGSQQNRPNNWATYPEITKSTEQASDHAAVYIDLNI